MTGEISNLAGYAFADALGVVVDKGPMGDVNCDGSVVVSLGELRVKVGLLKVSQVADSYKAMLLVRSIGNLALAVEYVYTGSITRVHIVDLAKATIPDPKNLFETAGTKTVDEGLALVSSGVVATFERQFSRAWTAVN